MNLLQACTWPHLHLHSLFWMAKKIINNPCSHKLLYRIFKWIISWNGVFKYNLFANLSWNPLMNKDLPEPDFIATQQKEGKQRGTWLNKKADGDFYKMIVSSYHQYSTYFRFFLVDQIIWNKASGFCTTLVSCFIDLDLYLCRLMLMRPKSRSSLLRIQIWGTC